MAYLWVAIVILILFLLFYSHAFQRAEKQVLAAAEGFANASVGDIVPDIETGQQRFNALTNLINLTNPALPFSQQSAQAVNQATATIDLHGGLPGAYNASQVSSPYKIPTTMPSTLHITQTICENVKTPNCAAFQNPDFAKDCGISFDVKGGTNSRGEPHVGGLYISPDDRAAQEQRAASLGLSPDQVQYQPSIGSAKKGQFAVDASSCQVIREQLDCQHKRNFDTPNCSQCFSSQSWNRVDPTTPRIQPSWMFQTNAQTVVVILNNGQQLQQTFTADTPTSLQNLPPIQEGDTWVVAATGDPSTLYFSGYLSSQTSTGTYNLDINAVVDLDLVTNYKPRMAGSQMVGQMRCFVIRPGAGQSSMKLRFTMPFSFLDPSTYDAQTCINGPVITTQKGADFLSNDSCYGPKNKPGAYSLDCLQQLWIGMGGTTSGTGYPGSATSPAVKTLLFDSANTARSLDDIGNYLYDQNLRASTGRDSAGNQLSVADWNTASMYCTGTPVTSPCEGPNKNTGPLTTECLQYLYTNGGGQSQGQQGIGPTYTLGPQYASTDSQGNTIYCRPEGRLSPTTAEGVARVVSLGGVAAVQKAYDTAHRTANDNTQSNSARREALLDCYGTDLQQQNPEVYWVGPGYQYTRDQAQQICQQYGGRVATMADIAQAYAAGAQWCAAGWVADDPNNAYYPMQTATSGCGIGTGVQQYGAVWLPQTDGSKDYQQGQGDPAKAMAGVNCYGPKPDATVVGNTISAFVQGTSTWYQSDQEAKY